MNSMHDRTPVLDHGYVKLIESWGSDERIIEAARMSTNKGFLGWDESVYLECLNHQCPGYSYEGPPNDTLTNCPTCHMRLTKITDKSHRGDMKLLRYLYEHKHSTPFEMAGLIIEVQAPIFVFREWHRHRTQCLAPDTMIHFDSPKSKPNRRFVYKLSIEDLWKKWQPSVRSSRPERQTNAFFSRSRIQAMQLRSANEDNFEIEHTRIVDVIKGEPKQMVKITTVSGKQLTASLDHKIFTDRGWRKVHDLLLHSRMYLVAVEGTKRSNTLGWETPPIDEKLEIWKPVFNWETIYEVSNMGRVRRRNCLPKKLTVGPNGYLVVSLNEPGIQQLRTVHSLVLESFVGPKPDNYEVCHKDHNRQNARLSNLKYGTAKDNSLGRIESDRQQRLIVNFEEILNLESVGELPSYDLTVSGPYHNFIADGFVVHNSYNEMSARYTLLPDVNYLPNFHRIASGAKEKANKQASSVSDFNADKICDWLDKLESTYRELEELYQFGLKYGVPKEVSRICLPVARYSKMRASANLRNWLAFLTLRMDQSAQWEIRQYANVVGSIISELFPRTWQLFIECKG